MVLEKHRLVLFGWEKGPCCFNMVENNTLLANLGHTPDNCCGTWLLMLFCLFLWYYDQGWSQMHFAKYKCIYFPMAKYKYYCQNTNTNTINKELGRNFRTVRYHIHFVIWSMQPTRVPMRTRLNGMESSQLLLILWVCNTIQNVHLILYLNQLYFPIRKCLKFKSAQIAVSYNNNYQNVELW